MQCENNLHSKFDNLIHLAKATLRINEECYIAQWVLQNPDKKIENYTMCHRHDWTQGGCMEIWMEKRV